MEVFLSNPRGFCAGVVRAIEIVELALQRHGAPVYVLHEIVHNRHVVQDLKDRGAVFVERLDEVPPGAVIIFSAHGVATSVVEEAHRRNLRRIDATCPLVTKVHLQAQRDSRQGLEVIIIGHPGHPEVEGTRGRTEGPVYVVSNPADVPALNVATPDRLAYVTQTTLSLDTTREIIETLKKRFPSIQGPDLNDICSATQTRRNAVRQLAKEIHVLLVVGSPKSSNSNRLRELGEQSGLKSYLIEDESDLKQEWFGEHTRVGITAGTSAPEAMVQRVLEGLRAYGVTNVTEREGEAETIHFRLPEPLSSSPE